MLDGIDDGLLFFVNGSNSLYLDSVMTTLTNGLTWIPLYIALFWVILKNNETMIQILLILASVILCVLFSGGIDDIIIKPYFARLRPFTDPVFMGMIHTVKGFTPVDFSFFSAHAANTFSIAVFICLLVRSRLLSVSMVIWSLINSYSRLYLGLHYFTDLIAGMIWGAVVAVIIYYIYHHFYKKISVKTTYISSQYTSTGYNRSDIDITIFILCLILMFAVIIK
jgi:undecaprenyl-diphosphatase